MRSSEEGTLADEMSSTHTARKSQDLEKGDVGETSASPEKADAVATPTKTPDTPSAAAKPPGVSPFGPDDPDDPRKWRMGKRVRHAAIVCLMTLSLTYVSSSYAISTVSIMREFHVSREGKLPTLLLCFEACADRTTHR